MADEQMERLIADIPARLKWDLEQEALEQSRQRGRKIYVRDIVIEALQMRLYGEKKLEVIAA